MQILKQGGSAVDAVEAAIRWVESNLDDHSVGIGGWPNLLGEAELDASIMDGRNRMSGAVGALRGYGHPISVARQVMEKIPHVFLVGQGAADFAAEMGFEREETLTDIASQEWMARLQATCSGRRRWRAYSNGVKRRSLTTDPQRRRHSGRDRH
ncbi:MAG: isoaspartyl peptidase/L-asparaginase [Caldilineaceae bacterium]